MKTATVIYHASCLDGFGAALAAWRALGDGADYLALAHGQAVPPEAVLGRAVHILDFSFPPADLLALAGQARSVHQLDHHVTARRPWQAQLGPEQPGLQRFCHPQLPLTVAFDLSRSGAALAWEHFHPDEPLPLALAHVEDQDLWRFALPGSRAFCRALRLLPFNFAAWDDVLRATPDAEAPAYRQMLLEGGAIERFCEIEAGRLAGSNGVVPARLRGEAVDALQAVRHGQDIVSDGDRSWLAIAGLALNASPLFASDVGQLLAEKSGTFGLVWHHAGGEIKASLRSVGAVDVARLAEAYGGGGHRNAAGFRLPAERFFSEILS